MVRDNPTTSGSSAPTRPRPTGWTRSTTSPTRSSPARSSTPTSTSRGPAGWWRSCPSTPARAGSRATLLTGRHGLFSCYEAFIHLVDSMFNQHAKWLKTTRDIEWRPQIASASTTCSAPTCGARTTTASPTRTPASSTTWSTRGPRSSGSTCRRTPTPCCRPCSTAWRAEHYVNVVVVRQAAVLRLADRGRRQTCTAPAAPGSGTGPPPTGGRPRRRDGLRGRRADPRDLAGRDDSCASTCPTCGSGSSTSST